MRTISRMAFLCWLVALICGLGHAQTDERRLKQSDATDEVATARTSGESLEGQVQQIIDTHIHLYDPRVGERAKSH